MGWCTGTYVFDAVCKALFTEGELDKESLLLALVKELEDMDWDCQADSDYYDNPTVQKVFRQLHPQWFDSD